MSREECCDNPNLCDRHRPETHEGTPLQHLAVPPPPKPPLPAEEEKPVEHPLGERYLSRAFGR